MNRSCPFSSGNPAGVSRRDFLLGASTVGSAAVVAGCGGAGTQQPAAQTDFSTVPLADQKISFDGVHQSGIVTPGQAHMNLVAFNFRAGSDKSSVRRLMKVWTQDARRLTQGHNPLGSLEPELAQVPANLTITCGFGARMFDIIGETAKRPSWLKPLPVFSHDALDDAWGEADVVLQLCCDDPLTLAFATRHMTRAAVDFVDTRWFQRGFLSAQGALEPGATPRNLFGQLDGTINPTSDDEYDDYVWIHEQQPAYDWLVDGTAMVVRRIAMNLDTWEILDRQSREQAMGRFLQSGAPLTGTDEFDEADFAATDEFGLPVIDPHSHMALAAPPESQPHQRLRRRAYNYNEAPTANSESTSNAGLVFVCFQQNPEQQFVPIQQRLNDADRMNTWITHIGSAVFAVPRGTRDEDDGPDAYWGASLLDS